MYAPGQGNLFDDEDNEPDRHHAARNSDPAASHAAKKRRAPGWDAKNGRALRIFDRHRGGLTYYEATRIAGPYALGSCPWKRCSELHTEWGPPLIVPLLDERGAQVMRPGEYGDPVGVYVITQEGIEACNVMRAKA